MLTVSFSFLHCCVLNDLRLGSESSFSGSVGNSGVPPSGFLVRAAQLGLQSKSVAYSEVQLFGKTFCLFSAKSSDTGLGWWVGINIKNVLITLNFEDFWQQLTSEYICIKKNKKIYLYIWPLSAFTFYTRQIWRILPTENNSCRWSGSRYENCIQFSLVPFIWLPMIKIACFFVVIKFTSWWELCMPKKKSLKVRNCLRPLKR